jgi:2-polyprenyl-3-methyl-5-hydroxy-6-metoxy-1,4-benzoquinol methylase
MELKWNTEGYYEVSPKPTTKELKEYYQNNYVEKKLQNGEVTYTEDEIFHKSLGCKEAYTILSKKSGSMLDIGCGEGFYLNYFEQQGWSVLGADFSKDGIHKNFPNLIDSFIEGDVFDTIDILINKESKFDLITINHVLEHVIDPKAIIEKLRCLMNKESVLRVSVPNDFSVIQNFLKSNGKIEKDFWICYPDHLNYFNVDGIRSFLDMNGFDVVDILAEFPIELYLMNDSSNYSKNPSLGKSAHEARISTENMMAKNSIEDLISFRRGCAGANIGRVVSAYCQIK